MKQAIPQAHFSYADYLHWQDDQLWELIDGEALLMAPAPTRLHQHLVAKLCRQIDEYLDDKPCEVYIAPFGVRLPEGDRSDDQIDTVVQPDLSIFCPPHRLRPLVPLGFRSRPLPQNAGIRPPSLDIAR